MARLALNVGDLAPLNPWEYAKHREVAVLEFSTLELSRKAIHQLTVADCDSWSAMTLRDGQHYVFVLNPAHKPTRQRNDLMHELAHVELKHVPTRVEVSQSGMLLLSDYSDDQEQEADWYAGALLVPRTALLHHRSQRKTTAEIAAMYDVSEALCEWRLRMTGVDTQLRRSNL